MSEEQLTIFDLLRQGKLLKYKEKHEVKEIARALLQRLVDRELQVEHWLEKIQTAAAVLNAINDYLFEHLPHPVYDANDIGIKTERVFEYVSGRYAALIQ